MKKVRNFILVLGMLALAGISACSDDGGSEVNEFDQRPFLENIGSNIIVPAYESLARESTTLKLEIDELIADPTESQLQAARVQLTKTRLAWQSCSFYQFGPAETNGLSAALNLYPVDDNQIQNNIASGTYDLNVAANFDARGLQTVAYLLYTGGTDAASEEEILASIADGATSQYLSDVVDLIATKSTAVLNAWSANGENYLATFTSEDALGVSVSSATGIMVNAFIQYYERNIRDGKVGIPVGIRSLGEEIPSSVEAPYAGNSLELLSESISALELFYLGGTNIGFDDYLQELATTAESSDLDSRIKGQFDLIENTISQLSDPLDQTILSNKSGVEQLFVEMQALALLFKTEMASQLGVSITFQDSDGD